MKFFSQIFGDMNGTSIFSAVMLVIFLVIFILVVIHVIRLPREEVNYYENMPLDKDTDASNDLT